MFDGNAEFWESISELVPSMRAACGEERGENELLDVSLSFGKKCCTCMTTEA